jgi:hypothetical protein
MKSTILGIVLIITICTTTVIAQEIIEDFEGYVTDEELYTTWTPSPRAIPTISDEVAPGAAGTTCMRVDFDFASVAWATEIVTGPYLEEPIAIDDEQYITFRLRGDPAFSASDFRNLYLYVYDENEDFVRWGTATPIVEDWQIINFKGSDWHVPWNGSGNIDMTRIVRFAFFQYGSGATPIDPYSASIHIDEIMIGDAPLVEFPPAAPMRELIDDFEGYADYQDLENFYSYENSWHPSITTADLESPAPQGNNALKLDIDFAAGTYPWGSVRSSIVEPFSFPPNGILSFRFKGDPTLADIVDSGTVFWISFYDGAGNGINYISTSDLVISTEWTAVQVSLDDFGDTSTVDIGNLVQWRILVEGWAADQAARSGSFYVDDIRISLSNPSPPELRLVRDNGNLKLEMNKLTPGTSYEILSSADLGAWSVTAEIEALTETQTWPVNPIETSAYYQLLEKP